MTSSGVEVRTRTGRGVGARDQARAAIFEYLEAFYNRVRRFSSLGFVSPVESKRTCNLPLTSCPLFMGKITVQRYEFVRGTGSDPMRVIGCIAG